MPNQDGYGPPVRSAVGGSARPTMASFGGGTRDRRPGLGRAAASLITPPDVPDIDVPKSSAIERYWEERYARKVRLLGSGVGVGAGFAWVSLIGPADGFVWNVRRLNVGPADYTLLPFATGITTIVAVGGQSTPPAGSASADQVATVSAAWPAEKTWGAGELTLEGGDYLWVAVAGITAGVTFTIGGQAMQTAVHVPEVYGIG